MRSFIYLLIGSLLVVTPLWARDVPEGVAKALEQLDFANGLFERRMYDMAFGEYENIIKDFPAEVELSEAYLGAGESCFFLKRYNQAVLYYERYLQSEPSAEGISLAKMRLGQSFLQLERFTESVSFLDQVDSGALLETQRQTYFFNLGYAHQMGGESARAMEAFYKATQIDDTNTLAVLSYLGMGDLNLHDSNYVKAIGFYENAVERASGDEQKYRALLKKGEAQYEGALYAEAVETLSEVVNHFTEAKVFSDALRVLFAALKKNGDDQSIVSIYEAHQAKILKQESFVPVHLQAVSAYAKLSQPDKAEALISALLDIEDLSDSGRKGVQLLKTKILADEGRYDQALEVIHNDLAGGDGAGPEVLYLQAQAYYGLGRFDEAAVLYRKILDQGAPELLLGDVRYGLAYALRSAGQESEALDEFIAFFRQSKDSQKQEQSLHAIILLSTRLNLISEGISYCQIYLTRFPKQERAEEVMYFLGGLYGQNQQSQDAVDIYKRYILTYPDSPRINEIYFLLAYHSQAIGQYDQAVLYYEKAAHDRADPERRYSALKNLAVVYLSQERMDEAVDMFSRLLRDFETNDLPLDTYLWLAEIYLSDGRYKEALDVAALSVKNPDLKDSLGRLKFFEAQALRFLKQYDEAGIIYKQVIDVEGPSPFQGEARLGLALSLMGQEDFARARVALAQLIEDSAEQHTLLMKARFALAEIEEQEGNVEEAVKLYMLVAVLYQSPDYVPRALYRAGVLMESLGQTEDALRNYNEVFSNYPDSNVAEHVQQRIEAIGEK